MLAQQSLGIACDDELVVIVLKHSSFRFMQERSSQFDEHVVFQKVRDNMSIPKDDKFGDVEVSQVRKSGGTTGEGNKLAPHIATTLEKRWENTVESKIGSKSYNELRQAANRSTGTYERLNTTYGKNNF